MTSSSGSRSSATWSVSKGYTAGAAVSVAIALASALAVVASIKHADTLATVALSLALLSFVLQILIFILQTSAVNNQMLQAQSLYAATADTGPALEDDRVAFDLSY